MDVTDQVQQIHLTYGGSDSTKPGSLSASKKLNYASGGSITKADNQSLSVIPFTFKYEDSVGLFGSENHFVKVTVDVDFRLSNLDKGVAEGDYFPAVIKTVPASVINSFSSAVIDYTADTTSPVNDFESAVILYGINPLPDGFLSIEVNNKVEEFAVLKKKYKLGRVRILLKNYGIKEKEINIESLSLL